MNWTQGLSGHLWQGRFFSCGLDETHLQRVVRYVERNPMRAGMAQRAEEYPWSSAVAHCGLRCEPWLADIPALSEQVDDWPAWLRGEEEDAVVAALRRHTSTGRPLGSATFLNLLESMLGRTGSPDDA